jgi:hypothetical protein
VTNGRAAGLYTLALVPTTAAAVVLSAWVMDLSSQGSGQPSGSAEWALNIVPALAVGWLVYFILARVVGRRQASAHSFGAHARRSVALYVIVIGLGVLLAHDGPSPDFWSFGQLVLWPFVAAAAGIMADGFTMWSTRSRHPAEAPHRARDQPPR